MYVCMSVSMYEYVCMNMYACIYVCTERLLIGARGCSKTSSIKPVATATCASVPVTRSCWQGSVVPGSGGRSSLSILMKARDVSRIRRMVAPPGPMSRRACSFVMTRLTSADDAS